MEEDLWSSSMDIAENDLRSEYLIKLFFAKLWVV